MLKTPAASRTARPMTMDRLEARQLLSAAASNVVSVKFDGRMVSAVANSYVVVTKSDAKFTAAAAKAGYANVESLGLAGFYSFTSDAGIAKVQKWAKTHGGVTAFQPNITYAPQMVPNDPLFPYQFAINNTGQLNPNPGIIPSNPNLDPFQTGTASADLDLPRAWDITTGSKHVVVAVMDTGIDIGHPDLAANLWVNAGDIAGDGIDNDGDGFVDDHYGWNAADENGDLTDLVGHGTAVSSAIGAVGNNGIGIVGASWNVSIMMVKTASADNTLSTAGIVRGYNFVTEQKRRGVDIAALNLSFGGTANEQLIDPVEGAAIRRVTAADIAVVTSAGNGGADGISDNNDLNPTGTQREASYNPRSLVVAALDNQGNLGSFSNYGPSSVAVGAPGVQTLLAASSDAIEDTANSTVTVPGTNVLTGAAKSYGYISGDGTSFSSPYVAGVIGLMEAAYEKYHGQDQHAGATALVQAVKDGAASIPQLNGVMTNGQKLVSTGGRVDAYYGIRSLLDTYVGMNTVSQGNWVGKYGSQAAFVYGASAGEPTIAYAMSSLVPSNAAVIDYPAKIKETNPSLLTSFDGSTRSTSYLFSPEAIGFNFAFNDPTATSATHRLTVYAASPDLTRRAETITISDTDSGRILQSVPLTKFASGKYVSFDVTGNVTLTVSGSGADGVVVNGIFVDAAPITSPDNISVDTTTGGNFVNTFGDLGYILPASSTSLPSFVTYNTTGTAITTKPSAVSPETIFSSKVRSGGVLVPTSGSSFDVSLTITDGSTRQVSFYLANGAKLATNTRIEQIVGGVVVASKDVTVAKSGEYVTFPLGVAAAVATDALPAVAYNPAATFRFTSLTTNVVPAVAGIFFNSSFTPGTAANVGDFISVDTKTQGNWFGKYAVLDVTNTISGGQGLENPTGYYLVGGPNTFTPVLTGPYTTTVLEAGTDDKAALQNPLLQTQRRKNRTLGQLATQSTLSANVDTGTTTPTQLTAYFVDHGNKGRVERIDLVDATTGAVLSTQVLRDFKNGKYLSYEVSGNVTLKVTRLAGPDAVLNALFKN